jgi:hypothetical protein
MSIFVLLGKAMMEQINRDKQRLLDNNIEKFPNNLSAIVDQDAGNEENQSQNESPSKSNSQQDPSFADRTVVERFEDHLFTPPARISETPAAKSAQAESGSEDLFADMDTSGSHPFKNIAPIASSTPFVGRRASNYQDRIQPRQGGDSGSDSDDEDKTVSKSAENEEEVFPNAMNISPIKRVGSNVGVPPSPAFSEVAQNEVNEVEEEEDPNDSFKTADGSSDDVEQFGPSQ